MAEISTPHIRAMLQTSTALAYWAQAGHWPPDLHGREDIRRFAESRDPRYALDYAAVLADHAAAELRMEAMQALGWPAV